MKADPMITKVQEPDGRWLAYCDEYRVASYGTSREDALEKNHNLVAQVSSDPKWLTNKVALPNLRDDDFAGPELVKVIARWAGIPHDYFAQIDDDE
jgi:hypothetical protein